MKLYKSKKETVEVYTFDELLAYGRNQPSAVTEGVTLIKFDFHGSKVEISDFEHLFYDLSTADGEYIDTVSSEDTIVFCPTTKQLEFYETQEEFEKHYKPVGPPPPPGTPTTPAP